MDVGSALKICSIVISHSLAQGIVDVESGGKPYSININSDQAKIKSLSLQTSDEAVRHARELIAAGYSIDMGLAQINSNNLDSLGLSVEQIFDPCTNLTAMQTVFLRGYSLPVDKYLTPQERLNAALSRYNTGHPVNGIKNGYVGRVLAAQAVADAKIIKVPVSPYLLAAERSIKPKEVKSDYVPDGYSDAVLHDE